MSTKQQEILKIEKDAKELVNNLRILNDKVGSYQSARNELEKTNSNLLSFIESTKILADKSHRIIEATNNIGSGKIFESLEKIDRNVKKLNTALFIGLPLIILLQIIMLLKS